MAKTPCVPYDLPPGDHDFDNCQCGRCGARQEVFTDYDDAKSRAIWLDFANPEEKSV
jgi:hypothetical protein